MVKHSRFRYSREYRNSLKGSCGVAGGSEFRECNGAKVTGIRHNLTLTDRSVSSLGAPWLQANYQAKFATRIRARDSQTRLERSRGTVEAYEDTGGFVRKFLFSSSVISAIFGGWSTLQTTRRGPRDWRLALLWLSWAISLAIAIGTVTEEARQHPTR